MTTFTTLPRQPISDKITRSKYCFVDETTFQEVHARTALNLFVGDPLAEVMVPEAERLMNSFAILPAGRILAGAGTSRNVTLINCFENGEIGDDMALIMAGASRVGLTMQRGGGIGSDFDNIRPAGALVKSVDAEASGPVSFMHIYNATGETVESAGGRRGAQMAVLSVWHPDIEIFIDAKAKPGILTCFNQSIKITASFMDAVRADADWDLMFPVPRKDGQHVDTKEIAGKTWYVYKRLPARSLWDRILTAAYQRAEPGVIFIDRVQEMNNLGYCETIIGSNPCGEQMLPAHGACNLGSALLPAYVQNPFTVDATFDFEALAKAIPVLVRMLDNVLDLTSYPLPEQETEAQTKRRIGVGTAGLGDALMMLGLRYGSPEALDMTREIKRVVRDAAYRASARLAKERSPFPAFDAAKYLDRPFIKALPEDIRAEIAAHGIRNGVLLSDAPTGTLALHAGGMSGGIEPEFALSYTREVIQRDGSKLAELITAPVFDLYCQIHGLDPHDKQTMASLPDYMVSAQNLTVEDHVRTQAACQEFVDSSISKTVNCPETMTFEAFKEVYDLAYDLGCKGCTTFRPNDVTGSVLSVEPAQPAPAADNAPAKRPIELDGVTIKVKVVNQDGVEDNLYIHLNHETDPVTGCRSLVEVFATSLNAYASNTLTAATVPLSIAMRAGQMGIVNATLDTLARIHGVDTIWYEGKSFSSVLPLLVHVIRKRQASLAAECVTLTASAAVAPAVVHVVHGSKCPKCGSHNVKHESGCFQCLDCGTSKCG